MFTGIVESMGMIESIEIIDKTESGGGGFSIKISKANVVLVDCHSGDSISCNGVCLTVTEFDPDRTWFKVGIAPETIRKTNLGELKVGDPINLERAMNGLTRFGGHYVQGHVDRTVTIVSITPDPPNSLIFHFHVPEPTNERETDFLMYVVPKGYVSLDGTSLTVIDVDWNKREFSVMLIAYTQTKVVIPLKHVGDKVNLEVDQVGKYVENMVKGMLTSKNGALVTLIENIVNRRLNQ